MTASQPTGERLIASRYRLHKVIGRGSMGVVWQAYDEVLHREVAVKEFQVPLGVPAQEADVARERTLREARAIAALTHPNVIAVYDVTRHDGEPFVVMELVSGQSLATVIRQQGHCTVAQTARVADSVASALTAAHRGGITHRDVKPGNVLVDEDGHIKLTDFGVARNLAENTITNNGLVVGTPAFIAPEVASGDPATFAADLWGLGATLFAAIMGRPPYDAGDPLATITEVVQGEVPIPDCDAQLAEVIMALMVKDPLRRMELIEVRQRVHSLLPTPDEIVFSPISIDEQAPERQLAERPQIASSTATSALLALDPGPLPFVHTVQTRSRRPMITTAVLVLAVVVFVAAAGGGFALIRTLSGQPLLPLSSASQAVPPEETSVQPLVPRTSQAPALNGAPGGQFVIDVPQDWMEFVEQQSAGTLPASTAVHFVKPDGTQEITVERFLDFYPNYSISRYLLMLRLTWPEGAFTMLPVVALAGLPDAHQQAEEITYRTVETNQAASGRTTFADVLPASDGELWVVSVTVPTDQEESGKANLFDKIKTTFAPTN